MKTKAVTRTGTAILLLIIVSFCQAKLYAQQMITFKSGLVVRAIVLDKTADSVCYQPVNDPQTIQCFPLWMIESITGSIQGAPVKDKAYWESKKSKFTGMTVAGGTMLGLGAILIGVSVKQVNDSEFGTQEDATGVGLFMISVVCVAGGTPLTIVGGANLGKANSELRKLNMDVSLNPAVRGVTLRLKF